MDWIVNRVATEKDLKPLYKKGYFDRDDVKKAWVVNDSTIIVQFKVHDRPSTECVAYNKHHNFIGFWDFEGPLGPLGKAVKHFEFKQSLNPSTLKTFEELIDEL